MLYLQAPGGVHQQPAVGPGGSTQGLLSISHDTCYFEATAAGGSVGHSLRRNYGCVEGGGW